MLQAISLFSNCGAGDTGYAKAGYDFQVMAEIDPRRLEVALLNHPDAVGIPGDLRETAGRVVQSFRARAGGERLALLAACPPCQGMSSARASRGKEDDPDAGAKDARNLLVQVVAWVAKELSPKIVVVENVPAFLRRLVSSPGLETPTSAATLLVKELEDEYQAFPFLTDLADYGVPQRRVRAFLTFVHREEECLTPLNQQRIIPYPKSTADLHVSLREALRELGASALDARSSETARDPCDPLHCVPVWGRDARYEMVQAIEPGSGGSAWQNSTCSKCGKRDVEEQAAVCPDCWAVLRRPVVKEADGTYRLVRGFRRTSYARMHPDKPSATITTASGHIGSDLTVHPFENRLLSVRECAHLQTFPASFDWGSALKRWGTTNVRAMIGEAVPPRFTELHGHTIRKVMEGNLDGIAATVDDPRSVKAVKRLSH